MADRWERMESAFAERGVFALFDARALAPEISEAEYHNARGAEYRAVANRVRERIASAERECCLLRWHSEMCGGHDGPFLIRNYTTEERGRRVHTAWLRVESGHLLLGDVSEVWNQLTGGDIAGRGIGYVELELPTGLYRVRVVELIAAGDIARGHEDESDEPILIAALKAILSESDTSAAAAPAYLIELELSEQDSPDQEGVTGFIW